MTSTVGYARISSDKEGAGLGVDRQAADIRDLARKLDLPEPQLLSDNDLSAYSGKKRPGYDELIKGLREGRWETLIVWHTDRLCRNLRDLEDLVDLLNGKVAVYCVKGGEIDLETPEGRMQARILGTLARYESEHRSDRVKRKAIEIAEAGRSHGGPRPYGWLRNEDHKATFSRLDPAESAIVRELTERVITGESIRSLAREMNARGVPSTKRTAWTSNAVKNLVIRARNAGLREHRGMIMETEGDWPKIVTRAQWEACRALLCDSARRTTPGNSYSRLLSGIARCGVCDDTVVSGGTGSTGKPIYRCNGGKHSKRQIAPVDAAVDAFMVALLAREGIKPPTAGTVPDDLRSQTAALRVKIENLEDMYAMGDLPRTAYLRNHDQLTANLADLERRIALEIVPGPAEGVTAERWASLPLDRKRAVIDHFLNVVILPGRNGNGGGGHHAAEYVKITKR